MTIKVRYADFTTITRSHSAPPTRDEADLTARAVRLLEKTDAGTRPVRLLGVSVHNFRGEHDVDETTNRLPFDLVDPDQHQGHESDKMNPLMSDTWDPASTTNFRSEREQPFYDLLEWSGRKPVRGRWTSDAERVS